MPAMDATISRTRLTTSSGALPINFGLRARQSRLRICEQRTTPRTGDPEGSGTSDEYPLILLVIGSLVKCLGRKYKGRSAASLFAAGLRIEI
jgi:hypothetical protein